MCKLKCPTCGAFAIGTVDNVPGTALFMDIKEGDTEAEYCGETRMHWDGQTTETGANGMPLLTCGEHRWEADVPLLS